jgi:hypothetical protein
MSSCPAESATRTRYYSLTNAGGASEQRDSAAAVRRPESIARQVEIVFTDERLKSLKLLRKHMNHDPGAWLDVDVVAKVHRVRAVCSNRDEMVKAVRLFSTKVLQVSDDGMRIRRVAKPKPDDNVEGDGHDGDTGAATATSQPPPESTISAIDNQPAKPLLFYVKVEHRGDVDERLNQLPWSLSNTGQDRVVEVSRDRDGVVLQFKSKQDVDVSIAAMMHGANWRSGLRCSHCNAKGGPVDKSSKRANKKEKKAAAAAASAAADINNGSDADEKTESNGAVASDHETSITGSDMAQDSNDHREQNTDTNTAAGATTVISEAASQASATTPKVNKQNQLVGIVTSLVEERTVGGGVVLSGFIKLEQEEGKKNAYGGRKKRRAETYEIRIAASSMIDEDDVEEGTDKEASGRRGPLKVGDRVKFSGSKNDTSTVVEHVTRLPRAERPKATGSTWMKNRGRISINTMEQRRSNNTNSKSSATTGGGGGITNQTPVASDSPSVSGLTGSSPLSANLTPVPSSSSRDQSAVSASSSSGPTVFVSAVGPDRSGDIGFTSQGWRNVRQGRAG